MQYGVNQGSAKLNTNHSFWKRLKRITITIIGTITLVIGVGLLVLPGPGIIVILIGVAILSVEYPWAKKVVGWLRRKLRRDVNKQA